MIESPAGGPITEDVGLRQKQEHLSNLSDIWTEEYSSPNGMVGVVAHWGVRWTRADMDEFVGQVAEEYGFDPNPIVNSGFDTLYRMPDGYTDAEIDVDVEKVSEQLVKKTLELKGWKPEDVDYLDFGSSVGKGNMARDLAAKLGMVNAQTSNAYLACNSAGYLLDKRLQDGASHGKKTLLLSVDAVTRLMRDTKEADLESIQLFSNGAAALAYQPGIDLKFLAGAATERRDSVGLTAVEPYDEEFGDYWHGDDDHVIFRAGDNSTVDMSPPPEGMLFRMKSLATTKFFIRLASETIASAYRQYKEDDRYVDHKLDFAVGHHPSSTVSEGLNNSLAKQGISLPFEWVVLDGNSSGATSLIAFNRSMSKYLSDQHGLYASYGAGGSANCFVVEIGKGSFQS